MVYYNPYYVFLFLWSLVWTLEVKNDKGLPLYPVFDYVEKLWYHISDLELEYNLYLYHCRTSVAIDKSGKK